MTKQIDFRAMAPRVADICRRYGVLELSLFGSALTADFRSDSDLDFLVEFEPDARVGLVSFNKLRYELEDLFGRHVDLVPKKGLKSALRSSVLSNTELLYAG